ncbi:hypothetical protein [Cytobacillus depressus]|uniref:hypothetical protein n=1 Tax=Cytobacillus depressus TaxID=1602942 RepID=UPI00147870A7|nr:hypothetical protein [Cytobacillus depressus]
MLGKNGSDALLMEKFAELLHEFYISGITNNDISIHQYLEEITEKLESLIFEYA